MRVLHRDLASRRGSRAVSGASRVITFAALVTLLAGAASALAPSASAQGTETGSISGTVTGLLDQAHQILVTACPISIADGSTSCAPGVNLTFTDGDLTTGAFIISGLVPGEYVVQVEATSANDATTGDSAPEPLIAAQYGEPVSVGSGTTVDAGSLAAEYGGQIHVSVTDADTTTPISGICMHAASETVAVHDIPKCSNDDGNYWTGGLSAGTYSLDLWDPLGRYPDQTMNGIAVGSTGTVDVLTSLSKSVQSPDTGDRTISGTVVDGNLNPVQSEVDLYVLTDDAGWQLPDGNWIVTDEEGAFSFDDLPDGTYALWISPNSGIPSQYFGGGQDIETATQITVDGEHANTGLVIGLVDDRSPLSGSVTQGIAGVYVAAYSWSAADGTDGPEALRLSDYASDVTETDGAGNYTLHLSPGSYTLVFTKPGFAPTFMGGGTSLPTEPTVSNSVTTIGGPGTAPAVSLAPLTIGGHAVNDLPYCYANSVAPNDDNYSSEIPLPFAVDFYGVQYGSIFVNNNGNVTFDEGLSQYTPDDLTTASHTPMIAPFFADVDTRGPGSQVVSYGASPDGKTFCVNWVDVGYFPSAASKINSFQLLLTTRSSADGRSEGDFDATFNYDQLQWESGDASGGENGLGGTSAAVGYTAGTGDTGTYFEFEGSREPGALVDGGGNALTAGHLNSTTAGRYIFQIRNSEAHISLGSIVGSVTSGDLATPVNSAAVQVCAVSGNRCFYTTTSASGEWSVPGAPVGDYRILVNPPSGNENLRTGSGSATVTAGETTTADTIHLGRLLIPASTTAFGNQDNALTQPTVNGVPSVYWDDPTVLSVHHETGHTATYTVTFSDGSVDVTGSLAEDPAGSGTYVATLPKFYPAHGEARVSVDFDAASEPAEVFDIYIDPSGVVTDLVGNPIAGATVTLQRSDSEDGPFTGVPNGSAIMSPSNRSNPSTTSASGRFAWDVTAGWYRLSVSADGFVTSVTDAFEVPPPRTDLVITLRPESTGGGGVESTSTGGRAAGTGTTTDSANRIAGSNRYATAAALATQFGTANAIIVANGIDAKEGADALAANYLAGRVKAPIVLAQANRVETGTLAAVRAVLKGAAHPTIYVMGGTDSVSDATANQIKTAAAAVATGTVTIKRIGGADRYATSALAATTPGSVTKPLKLSADGIASTTAILASGEVNADALAAGALSYGWGVPVLLTRSAQLPKSVANAITTQKITQLIVLGGSDRVSQAVLDQAKAAGVTDTKRIAGADRFDTSAQLYAFAMATLTDGFGNHYGASDGAAYIANGVTGFSDALAVGPLAGTSGGVLLTVRPDTLGDPAAAFIKAHKGTLRSVIGLGSASTIAESVLTQATGLL